GAPRGVHRPRFFGAPRAGRGPAGPPRLRTTGVEPPHPTEGAEPSGYFSAATGVTVYRGDAWPAEYRGQVFVGEVANNLLYRARPEPNGIGCTALRADPGPEFLASTDIWFRPVQ